MSHPRLLGSTAGPEPSLSNTMVAVRPDLRRAKARGAMVGEPNTANGQRQALRARRRWQFIAVHARSRDNGELRDVDRADGRVASIDAAARTKNTSAKE